jgi:hypothetical protein
MCKREKGKKIEGVPVRVEVVGRGLLGWLLPGWAGSPLVSPVRLSLFFLFCNSFYFLFLFFFYVFCKTYSNDFKPNANVF